MASFCPPHRRGTKEGRISGGRKLKGTEAGGGVTIGGNYSGSHNLCQAFLFIRNSVRLVASFLYDREDKRPERLSDLAEVTYLQRLGT